MTLTYPLLPSPLRFSEDSIQVLVIEHAEQMRKAVFAMKDQINGNKGEFVFSERGELKELSKAAVLVTDLFSLEFDTKRILTKINQEACKAGEEHAAELRDILAQIGVLAAKVCTALDFDAIFELPESWEELIKLMGFHIDTQNISFPEQVVEFMKIQRKLLGKKLFVFYNLKACLSEWELFAFYKTVQYEKLNLLLLEDAPRKRVPEYENMRIIDEDLCVF